jgi:hypothetical protein
MTRIVAERLRAAARCALAIAGLTAAAVSRSVTDAAGEQRPRAQRAEHAAQPEHAGRAGDRADARDRPRDAEAGRAAGAPPPRRPTVKGDGAAARERLDRVGRPSS